MSGVPTYSIDVGSQSLEFHLRRSARRKTLEIAVEPDCRVMVTAPTATSLERITKAVQRRAGWIHQQQRTYEDLPPPPPPRQWVAGETHRYLGRQYRLKVLKAGKPSVRLTGAFFEVVVPQISNRKLVQSAMEHWYREHAENLLKIRVSKALAASTWLRLPEAPQVFIRAMRLRWGSATQKGRLYFNLDIVKLPLGCIDYIVIHELAHLKVPNHGQAFWRLLALCLPDWKHWKERLARQEV
jgi:predicted metal-dependent hydrolase